MSINIKTTGVHHVAPRSTDMKQSKRFYTEILGFEVRRNSVMVSF
ncbi:MAG TPA: VOC family protein [Pyrinomonadaceae bacterium]|nr:VOC family protein [Pyrinomonadaceae bacterium]